MAGTQLEKRNTTVEWALNALWRDHIIVGETHVCSCEVGVIFGHYSLFVRQRKLQQIGAL